MVLLHLWGRLYKMREGENVIEMGKIDVVMS